MFVFKSNPGSISISDSELQQNQTKKIKWMISEIIGNVNKTEHFCENYDVSQCLWIASANNHRYIMIQKLSTNLCRPSDTDIPSHIPGDVDELSIFSNFDFLVCVKNLSTKRWKNYAHDKSILDGQYVSEKFLQRQIFFKFDKRIEILEDIQTGPSASQKEPFWKIFVRSGNSSNKFNWNTTFARCDRHFLWDCNNNWQLNIGFPNSTIWVQETKFFVFYCGERMYSIDQKV